MQVPVDSPAVAAVPLAERAYQQVLRAGLAALGFFLLFSTAGTSIAMFVLLLLCLAAPMRILRLAPWREPVLACGLVLLAYIGGRTFLADVPPTESLEAVNRYHELLMLPLLWALLRIARRPQAFINGLMLGAVVFASAHWLAPYSQKLEWFLHTRRISGGFGLAVCAFLLFEHARLGRLPPWFGYGLAAYLAATVIFASSGRTGHLVLLLLLVCASFRASPPRLRMAVVLATLASGLLMASASNAVRSRVEQTWAEVQAATSPSLSVPWSRKELLRTGLHVAEDNWVLGTGWGAYPEVFADVARRRHGGKLQEGGGGSSVNPHNEYLLQLGAGGVPALLLFVLWLSLPVVRAYRERREGRPWAGAVACVALAFGVGALFNSVLLDFVEGHFYAAMLAWLLVRRTQS